MKWKTLKNIFVLKVPIAIHNVNDYRFKKLNIPLCPKEERVFLCRDSNLFDLNLIFVRSINDRKME